jgi:hypothetical protein
MQFSIRPEVLVRIKNVDTDPALIIKLHFHDEHFYCSLTTYVHTEGSGTCTPRVGFRLGKKRSKSMRIWIRPTEKKTSFTPGLGPTHKLTRT